MATLRSLKVRRPKDVAWRGRTVHTGAWKHPVDDPLMVRRLNVDTDGQGDLQGHGGEQRAVLVYQTQSYAYWRKVLKRDDLEFGQFGENFTVDGPTDDEECIGDRYRIGEAEFEVTQPRVTCYRVGMRLNEPRMASLLVAHHRPRLLPPRHHRGPGPGRGPDHTDPHRQRVADRRRHRCPPLPSGPRSGQTACRLGDRGAQPRMAAVLPGDERAARPAARPRSRRAGLDGLQTAARDPGRARDPHGVLVPPAGRGLTGAAPGRARPVPDRTDPQRRPTRTGAFLFAVLRPRCRRVPDQRQTRRPRHGQHLAPHASAPRRRHRSSRPSRDVRTRR